MKDLRISHSAKKEVNTTGLGMQQSSFIGNTDAEIWNAFCKGDESALIFIYNQYFDLLYRYACQFSKDQAFIKDCIQDLFIDLYKGRSRLGATTSIRFYLYRSLRRRLVKNGFLEKMGLREEMAEGDAFGLAESPEKHFLKKEQQYIEQAILQEAIEQLPKRQKEAIYYYFYENFSYEQIAELMGMGKVKSARTLVYRAIDNMRDKLTDKNANKLLSYTSIFFLLLTYYAQSNLK